MIRTIIIMLGLLLSFTDVYARHYKLTADGYIMPDLNSPVVIVLSEDDGNGYKEVPTKRYSIQSPAARKTASDRITNSFMLHKQAVYLAKGAVPFSVNVNGENISLTLDIPILQSIRFNLYTDSIKPILNYYVNVEGIFSNGKILPVDTSLVSITSDNGHMSGMEWVLPRQRNFEQVTFSVTSRFDPSMSAAISRYLKKAADPRDDPNYQERTEEEIIKSKRRR